MLLVEELRALTNLMNNSERKKERALWHWAAKITLSDRSLTMEKVWERRADQRGEETIVTKFGTFTYSTDVRTVRFMPFWARRDAENLRELYRETRVPPRSSKISKSPESDQPKP